MQEQEVEVFFCDLCGTSVPAADIEAGTAAQHEGKTVGACCLAGLRGGTEAGKEAGKAGAPDAAVANGGAASSGSAGVGASADSGRMLTMGIVLLVAIAGSVLFLDSRLTHLEEAQATAREKATELRHSDSQVLMGLDLKVDRAATRVDVEAAASKAKEVGTAVELLQTSTGESLASLQTELATVRRDLKAAEAKLVDYRPLFDDLRDRHQRALIAIEKMRVAALAQPVVSTPVPVVEEATAKPVDDLPPELGEQVRKLTAADPAVRFEAVDVLGASKNEKVLPHLLPLAKDPDAFVRRLTVEVLREFQKAEAVDVLLDALDDEDEYVRDTAWRSLRAVTGQKLPFEPTASKDGRKRAVQKWRDWWAKARATFG